MSGNQQNGTKDTGHALNAWEQLCSGARDELFEQTGLRRGLVIHEYGGVGRSSQNPVTWEPEALSYGQPSTPLERVSYYSFSEITRDLAVIGVAESSIPFMPPWLCREVEYDYQKSLAEKEGPATAYLLEKHIVNKITIDIPPQRMTPDQRFMDITKEAILNLLDSHQGYANLIKVFNTYGYYVASRLTLGGALIRQHNAGIEHLGDASAEQQAFSARFKETLDDIRLGPRHGDSIGEAPVFGQMGGEKDTAHHYGQWTGGLRAASNWGVTSYKTLIPTLALIGMRDMALGNACYHLLRKYSTYDEVKELQVVMDMSRYANEAKQYFLNPI